MNTDNQQAQEVDLTTYIPNVHFELIPIKNLVSNQDYQRNLSEKHVQKAAAHFDICQINPIKVSRRDGLNYVFNGQHTIEIIALVSGSRDTPVWCMIYDDLVYEQEADIFANQMKYTKALSPYEIFMANIEAGNDIQLMIRDLVESYDLSISSKNGPGTICAVSALENIFIKHGYKVLDHVLALISGTWEGEPRSYSANMLNGVARLVTCYGESLNDETFKEKLSRISIKEISKTARDRRAGSLGFAEVMVIEYNKRNTSHALRYEKLYSNKGKQANRILDEEPEETMETPVTEEAAATPPEVSETAAGETIPFPQTA